MSLKAPFPWFGGKSRASPLIWQAFGHDVPNYVEPFAGSLAVLLGRKLEAMSRPRIETVNDKDAYLANFWRAVKWAPEAVAEAADWPVNEADLHARHRYLVAQSEFRERMRREPRFYDVEIAGWWVWGLCQWIGGGWCAESNWNPEAPRERGNFTAEEARRPHLMGANGVHRPAGNLTAEQARRPEQFRAGKGINGATRQIATAEVEGRPTLTRGKGVHSRVRDLSNSSEWEKRPSLEKGGRGVQRTTLTEQMPMLAGDSGAAGRGVHASALPQKLPSVGRGGSRGDATAGNVVEKLPLLSSGSGHGAGVHNRGVAYGPILAWMQALADRLRRVRVCCGDFERVLGRSVTELIGTTAILFDPPYLIEAGRDASLYSVEDGAVALRVREWCLEHGDNPKLRIALCGYEGEHEMPDSWQCVSWKAVGGYAAAAGNTENAHRERIWFSPACLRVDAPQQTDLFKGVANG